MQGSCCVWCTPVSLFDTISVRGVATAVLVCSVEHAPHCFLEVSYLIMVRSGNNACQNDELLELKPFSCVYQTVSKVHVSSCKLSFAEWVLDLYYYPHYKVDHSRQTWYGILATLNGLCVQYCVIPKGFILNYVVLYPSPDSQAWPAHCQQSCTSPAVHELRVVVVPYPLLASAIVDNPVTTHTDRQRHNMKARSTSSKVVINIL